MSISLNCFASQIPSDSKHPLGVLDSSHSSSLQNVVKTVVRIAELCDVVFLPCVLCEYLGFPVRYIRNVAVRRRNFSSLPVRGVHDQSVRRRGPAKITANAISRYYLDEFPTFDFRRMRPVTYFVQRVFGSLSSFVVFAWWLELVSTADS